jgi:hypothetical protein
VILWSKVPVDVAEEVFEGVNLGVSEEVGVPLALLLGVFVFVLEEETVAVLLLVLVVVGVVREL